MHELKPHNSDSQYRMPTVKLGDGNHFHQYYFLHNTILWSLGECEWTDNKCDLSLQNGSEVTQRRMPEIASEGVSLQIIDIVIFTFLGFYIIYYIN